MISDTIERRFLTHEYYDVKLRVYDQGKEILLPIGVDTIVVENLPITEITKLLDSQTSLNSISIV